MKKTLLLLAALAATSFASADEWQKPAYSGSYQPLTAGDTVYIYNTEAKQFLTKGNDWGTHASVGNTGLKFIVNQYAEEGAEWDGKTYTISDLSVVKKAWKELFINADGLYVDRGNQADYFFSFKDLGNNTYNIIGADINPTYNAVGDMEGYMVGHFTGYVNNRDGIESGTGVIYDYYGADNNYAPGEFNTVWAFVSQADYAEYEKYTVVYEQAQILGSSISEALNMGITGIEDEQAVYANTSSTLDEVKAAIESLEKKKLAYYEQTITPDNPVVVVSDECNSIANWTNNINASTWNTQSWIDGSWEGFDGTTLNIWSASLNGTAYRSLSDMPNGVYVVSMAVYSEKTDIYAYANENTVAIAGGAAGKTYTITTNVTDGTLEYGIGQSKEATNWVALDNATVKYYGKGLAAYKYWVNSLAESTPSFDDVILMESLIDEYNEVVKSISAAQTDEEILAAIPAYEAILNKIALNVNAYQELQDEIATSENLISSLGSNLYYGEMLGDAITVYGELVENHNLDTEAVNENTSELKKMNDEAQNYIWNFEKLTNELTKAADTYEANKETCPADAVEAYLSYINSYEALDKTQLKNEDVLNLLDELYAIEFNLNLKDEPASDTNPIDYTAKFYNPSFDGVDGWTNDGWSTFSNNTWYGFANEEGASSGDGNYLNLWNENSARGYQTVTGLPAGAYTVQCGAYADNEGLVLYANNETVNVEVGKDGEGNYMRIYTINVIVGEDGVLEFGVKNTNGGTMWAMIDEVHLTYKGTDSEIMTRIECINSIVSTASETIYSVSGVKLSSLSKGINIVKNSDGKVQKIMVK